jgi:hypothetical protein
MKDQTILFDDGTEPTIIRQYCNGPCAQGRKPCPIPEACEVGDSNLVGLVPVVLMGVAIVAVVGVIAFLVGVFA